MTLTPTRVVGDRDAVRAAWESAAGAYGRAGDVGAAVAMLRRAKGQREAAGAIEAAAALAMGRKVI